MQDFTADSQALFERGADALETQAYFEAAGHFEAYLALRPQDADAWQNLGVARFYAADFDAALKAWQQALTFTREPDSLEETILDAAHELVHEQQNSAAAQGFYALLLDSPRLGRRAHSFLLWCLIGQNRMPEALELVETALKKYPNELGFRLQNTFLLPGIYQHAADIDLWRQRFLQALDGIEAWLDSDPVIESQEILTYSPIFNLMPMGMNEKATFQRISRLWRRLFVGPNADAVSTPAAGPKLRLALVSASVWNHSTMHYFQGMLEMLTQQPDIETALFDFAIRRDSMTDYFSGLVSHYQRIEREPEAALRAIRAWQPEILMYLDIGQETLLYTLAHHRLAPLQCVTAGVPITTGIDTVDAYFSSDCFEIPSAQAHYSERLIRLDQLMVCMRPPQMPPVLKDRAAYGIPAESHFYFFPHTLFRVDPELDAVLSGILTRDPQAEIYFMQLLKTGFHQLLLARFRSHFPDLLDRVHFLPWQSQPDFLNLLSLADVALDAHRLAGGNVSFQAFWTGTPMVVYPSEFLRGRIGAGLYRLLGLEQWIASDWDDYLEKALKLGTDPSARQTLAGQILAGRDKIFNRPEGMQEIFAWFRNWRQQYRSAADLI